MTRAASEDGERRCEWHDTLVENFGKNGKNGKLGVVIADVKEMRIEMKQISSEQTKMKIRIALITGGGSIVGSGLVALASKLLG